MKRTQISITEDQDRRIGELAADRGVSKAAVIRHILDQALHTGDPEAEALAAIEATAGVCAAYPDWPEWLRAVRGRSPCDSVREFGL